MTERMPKIGTQSILSLSKFSTDTTETKSKTTSTSTSKITMMIPEPTFEQHRLIFINAAVPMIGLGLIDQTIMLQSGNVIDCTIGVILGLSTLTAAGVGQIVSMSFGVAFGDTLERFLLHLGLQRPVLVPEQHMLSSVRQSKFIGSIVGVIIGCSLGLLNILFIDTDRSETLKVVQAYTNDQQQGYDYIIEASNSINPTATVLNVTGPDTDGLLASITLALSSHGCSVIELHASTHSTNIQCVHDIFHIVKKDTGTKFHDDELYDLTQRVLESIKVLEFKHDKQLRRHETVLQQLSTNKHK